MKIIELVLHDPEYNGIYRTFPNREGYENWVSVVPNIQAVGIDFPSYAWPGGYPIYYLTQDGGVLCSKCANNHLSLTANDTESADPQWSIVASSINYEDTDLYCNHCDDKIEEAYPNETAE